MDKAQPSELVERFFIDHGMIHDRVTGKHVSTEPIEFSEGQFDASPTHETCALLNSLASPTPEPCRVREALERALLAFDNVLGELEAHQENTGEALEEEDQAVVHGAKADAEFARAALSASPDTLATASRTTSMRSAAPIGGE